MIERDVWIDAPLTECRECMHPFYPTFTWQPFCDRCLDSMCEESEEHYQMLEDKGLL